MEIGQFNEFREPALKFSQFETDSLIGSFGNYVSRTALEPLAIPLPLAYSFGAVRPHVVVIFIPFNRQSKTVRVFCKV